MDSKLPPGNLAELYPVTPEAPRADCRHTGYEDAKGPRLCEQIASFLRRSCRSPCDARKAIKSMHSLSFGPQIRSQAQPICLRRQSILVPG